MTGPCEPHTNATGAPAGQGGTSTIEAEANRPRWHLRWRGWRLVVELDAGRLSARIAGTPAGEPPAPPVVPAHLGRPLLEEQTAFTVATHEHGEDRFRLNHWEQTADGALHLELDSLTSGLTLTSRWHADPDTNVITHSARLTNAATTPLTLMAADSLALAVPAARTLTFLTGQWIRETQRCTTPARTPLLLESRAGKTGFEHAPYLTIHAHNFLVAVSLAWSGNWFLRSVADPGSPSPASNLVVRTGLNPWQLAHQLRAREELDLPVARISLTDGDLNSATQQLHSHRRARLGQRPVLPVQFNSWYPHQQRPTLAHMQALATTAADLGCEVFVQDAGWYALSDTAALTDPDLDWWARVGDWVTDPDRFPGGLVALGDHVRGLGLELGVWFEPEAVSTSAALLTSHPDWMHPTASAGAGRRIANLGRPDVRDHLASVITGALHAAGARWMKWDCNVNLTPDPEARSGLRTSAVAGSADPVLAHTLGVYELQQRILDAVPGLILEMCAGGGGRFDDAILERAHTNWMSDQTQPLANLSIHFGSQLLHLPEECNDWLIDWPPHDTHAGLTPVDDRGGLGLRAAVASLGTFGISAPLQRWSSAERRQVTDHITWYKNRIRPRFAAGADQYLYGDQPTLDGHGDWAGAWYTDPDAQRGHLTAFRLAEGDQTWNPGLEGLDPDQIYRVTTPNGEIARHRGRDLADGALELRLDRFEAMILSVDAVTADHHSSGRRARST